MFIELILTYINKGHSVQFQKKTILLLHVKHLSVMQQLFKRDKKYVLDSV